MDSEKLFNTVVESMEHAQQGATSKKKGSMKKEYVMLTLETLIVNKFDHDTWLEHAALVDNIIETVCQFARLKKVKGCGLKIFGICS